MVFSCAQTGNDEHLLYARCRSRADAACRKQFRDFLPFILPDFNRILLGKVTLICVKVVHKCVRRLGNRKGPEIYPYVCLNFHFKLESSFKGER